MTSKKQEEEAAGRQYAHALAGGAAGLCVAGPVGALVGSAIGNASCAEVHNNNSSFAHRYLPQLGGVAVACAALCVAGRLQARQRRLRLAWSLLVEATSVGCHGRRR